jgi:hypothetical protein
MKVFHYASIEHWQGIVNGSWKSGGEPGLGASYRMGHQDEEAYGTSAVFALLEPLPASWIQNPYFMDIWRWLVGDIGDGVLLEIETDPNRDNVFVVDRAHVEGVLYEDKTRIPERYSHPSILAAERAYMQSKVSLNDYLAGSQELQYSLPEVIFPQNVPFDRLKISDRQPLIEEGLSRYGGDIHEKLIYQINRIPDLRVWYAKYEARQQVEGATVGKERMQTPIL